MPHCATSTLTADDKRRIISALPPSTSNIFAMARGQIYHAPFTATSSSEWKPLDLRGAIVFGRDTRDYEIRDDASSGISSLGSFKSAKTSDSSAFMGVAGVVSEEPESMPVVGDGASDLAENSRFRNDDELWFRLVEIDPHQKKPAKVVWRQPVMPASSDYKMLVPFFHAFSGNVSVPSSSWSTRGVDGDCSDLQSRMFGFRFEDDDEAYQFYETVMVRTKARRKSTSAHRFTSLITYPPPSSPSFPPALVKPNSGPRSWSKSVRRRTTMAFSPAVNQITDPEPGSFQHKAHVGINEKGDMVAEGEVDRRWSSFLDESVRPKVSSVDPPLIRCLGFDLVSFPASTISNHPRLEKVEEVLARLTPIPTLPFDTPICPFLDILELEIWDLHAVDRLRGSL